MGENNLESLQSQIVDILGAVDKDRVDVSVGQTAIRNDQAVVLAWNKNQTLKKGFKLQDKVDDEDEGVLLYLAIRYKRNPKASNEEQRSNSISTTMSSPDTAISNENRDHDGSPRLKELTHDENNNSGANSGDNNSTPNSVHNDSHISSGITLPKAAIIPKISLSEDNSGSEESFYHDYYPASYDGSTSHIPSNQDFIKKKRKKSVHWRENLEDGPSSKPLQTPSSSSSLESEELSATKIQQQRPQSSRRTSASDEAHRRQSRDSFQRQQEAQLQQQQRISLLRRQLSVDHPSQSVTPRRSRSLDDISSNEEGKSVSSYRRRESRVRRPCSRRTRSCSPEPDWSQPLGVLTTKMDPSSLRLDSNVVLPQTPNKIRRLRSKHARFAKNVWYVGSTEKSFNSRCSKKFYIDDLDENSAHYYYFRSYPKVAPSSSSISPSTLTNYSSSFKNSSSTKFE
ncbi:unnamed protein product [Lepeophtheirus salmonis]|uniref:(salmon louse) hypothetical protein n=1 Tax=Lepeophtheirus salmonis TaxID=72036 RepID=A0A7R8H4U8_LEPSM|nr:unnamed protein product [Lepeophtheirus salmonis]CAF2866221.1 unnamed protein product [Lepeophtheirus salmonis]